MKILKASLMLSTLLLVSGASFGDGVNKKSPKKSSLKSATSVQISQGKTKNQGNPDQVKSGNTELRKDAVLLPKELKATSPAYKVETETETPVFQSNPQ